MRKQVLALRGQVGKDVSFSIEHKDRKTTQVQNGENGA